MTGKYELYYDESEHSRKINQVTLEANNYYDKFISVVVGWAEAQSAEIENKYKEFEEKYADRKSRGELKSRTINNKQIRHGLASLTGENTSFVGDFLSVFDEKIYIYISLTSKIEYIIDQLFINYKNGLNIENGQIIIKDMDSMKFTIAKSIDMYRPKKLIEGMYVKPNEFVELLKGFYEERILENKKNPELKSTESHAFSDVLKMLNNIETDFKMNWEYSFAFEGLKKYLKEQNINEYNLVTDKEGNEKRTLIAAKTAGIVSTVEADSKECIGIRWADMFAGILAKIFKAISAELQYQSVDDGINKKLLSTQWFELNDKHLQLYKQLNYVIKELHASLNKVYLSKYADNYIYLKALIEYISGFDSIEVYKQITNEEHASEVNKLACQYLGKHFSNIQNKLPVEQIPSTDKDFFIGQRGQKIYFDDGKQPRLELRSDQQMLKVLSVGVSGNGHAQITLDENGEAVCYSLPDTEEISFWINACLGMANLGDSLFPADVLFTKQDNKYYIYTIILTYIS